MRPLEETQIIQFCRICETEFDNKKSNLCDVHQRMYKKYNIYLWLMTQSVKYQEEYLRERRRKLRFRERDPRYYTPEKLKVRATVRHRKIALKSLHRRRKEKIKAGIIKPKKRIYKKCRRMPWWD